MTLQKVYPTSTRSKIKAKSIENEITLQIADMQESMNRSVKT